MAILVIPTRSLKILYSLSAFWMLPCRHHAFQHIDCPLPPFLSIFSPALAFAHLLWFEKISFPSTSNWLFVFFPPPALNHPPSTCPSFSTSAPAPIPINLCCSVLQFYFCICLSHCHLLRRYLFVTLLSSTLIFLRLTAILYLAFARYSVLQCVAVCCSSTLAFACLVANTLQHNETLCMPHTATHCMQRIATHCNTLQLTATHEECIHPSETNNAKGYDVDSTKVRWSARMKFLIGTQVVCEEVCGVTLSRVWHNALCVLTHSHVWHDAFCVMTHSHAWREAER